MSWKSRILRKGAKFRNRVSPGSAKNLDKKTRKRRKWILKLIPFVLQVIFALLPSISTGIVLISSWISVWFFAPCGGSIGEMLRLLADFGSLHSTSANACVSQTMTYYSLFMIGILAMYLIPVGQGEQDAGRGRPADPNLE